MSSNEQKGYSFDESGETYLSASAILNRVTDGMLWRHYVGRDFTLNKKFNAPYRDDRNPSFKIFKGSKGTKLYGIDYSRGFCGDIFDYLQYIYNIDFRTCLAKINKDFNLNLYDDLNYLFEEKDLPYNPVSVSNTLKYQRFDTEVRKRPTTYKVVPRLLNPNDLKYWGQFGITNVTLGLYNVYAVDTLFRSGYQVYSYDKNDPCYAYFFPEARYRDEPHFKIYYPMRTEGGVKFEGNITNDTDIQGYDQCSMSKKEKSDTIIMTKSMKDCMTMRELGYESVAIHGETHKYNEDFIRHVKKYYRCVLSLYDRDSGGMIGSRRLWKDYDIVPFFIDKRLGSKDISDLYRDHGKETAEQFLRKIVNKAVEYCEGRNVS